MARLIEEIEFDIAEAEKELAQLLLQAPKIQGDLQALARRTLSAGIQRLNDLGRDYYQACEDARDARSFGWDHRLWQSYQAIESDVLEALRIGGLREPESLKGEKEFDFPVLADLFSSDGPLIFRHGRNSADDARNSFQSLLLRIAVTLPGQVRFALIDPAGMGSAYPFRGFLGRDLVRITARTPGDELSEVLDDIRRINERVIHEAPRFAATLTSEQRAGELFEVVAIADFPKAYAKDSRAMDAIVRIANGGPRAGRHLVIEWDSEVALPHGFSQSDFKNATCIDLLNDSMRIDTLPDPSRQRILIDKAYANARRRGGGDWNSIVRPAELMSELSIWEVATPVGERLNFWLGESEDGKPSAHAMFAGQTGSGKSYLLHVIITGLAARYSPSELRLTLIDGKQGVEFEAYRHLPHADVVCLRTAPALARSVLADFVSEMEERYERFQAKGVAKLADYRNQTGEVMPRRVLIVDEYQQLLEGDSETGAALLGKLLEKGRASGMHVVLGSQTFEQRGLPHSAFTHIHCWGSLSLTENYAQSLQVFGSEGKRLIRDLAPKGEIVLNDEGGRDGANSRGAVASLQSKSGELLLPSLVKEICEAAGPGHPLVLSGREGALPSDNPHLSAAREAAPLADELQRLARLSPRDGGFGLEGWNKADRPVPLWLGRKFDVRGHALCALRRTPGQNLLILGSQAEVRHRMLACALAGLGAMLPPDSVEIIFVDGLHPDMPGGGMISCGLDRLAEAGVKIDRIEERGLEQRLDMLTAAIAEPDPDSPSRLLIISEPDYLYSLHGGVDRFSAPSSGPTVSLRKLLTRGPQNGLRTILTASGISSFQLVLSPSREASLFNHRVVQQMNEEDSMSLFSSLLAARLSDRADHPFAALHIDQMAGPRSAALFSCYCANRALGANQSRDDLARELRSIAYPQVITHVA